MKRSSFSQKNRKPLKRSSFKRRYSVKSLGIKLGRKKSKKTKKSSISRLKHKLWANFSLYIRTRDNFTCFTCGRKGEGSGIHAGHFISKSVGGIALYFHEDNVHAQCYNCNINLSGNQWEYGQRLGKEKVDELMKLKEHITKWSEQDYLEKIKFYGDKIL